MIKNAAYNIYLRLFIISTRIFGNELDKLLINVAAEYFSLITDNKIHEDAIYTILKEYYGPNKSDYDDASYFIFRKHSTIDNIYSSKYGKSGRFMSHLFKLVQKIYLDKYLDDNRESYTAETTKTTVALNKKFNKVMLYLHSKYQV